MAGSLENPYEVLGVTRDATDDEIRSAYRRLAMQYHPDRNPGDLAAEERFKVVSEAYATLRDPRLRERYDLYGSTRPEAARPDFSTVDWQTLFREADVSVTFDPRSGSVRTGNLVFDMMFGALTSMMRGSGLLPGEDRTVKLEFPLEDARSGGDRRVHIPGPSVCATCHGAGLVKGGGPCPGCGGRGVVRGGAVVDVSVPAGVRDGLKLRLRGLGGPGRPPGDALVTVNLKVPNNARLAGDDIYIEVPVTPLETSSGRTLTVLGVPIKLPVGAKNGEQVRVPKGGLNGGDLVVTLTHDVWRGLWRNLKDLFRVMRWST